MLNDMSRYLIDLHPNHFKQKSMDFTMFGCKLEEDYSNLPTRTHCKEFDGTKKFAKNFYLRLEERAKESRLQDLLEGAETKVSGMHSVNLHFQLIDFWKVTGVRTTGLQVWICLLDSDRYLWWMFIMRGAKYAAPLWRRGEPKEAARGWRATSNLLEWERW